MKVLACAGLWPALMQSPAVAAPVDTIAVLDFKPNNASAGDAATVSVFVRAAFVKGGAYTVVDKANMEKVLAEQAFQQTGCTDSGCAVKLGKMLNVKKMVVGEYSVMGGLKFLTSSLVDVETGRVEATAIVKDFEPKNVYEAAEDLARQLTGGAGEKASAEEARKAAEKAQAEEAKRKAEEEAVREAARREKERLEAERNATEASRPVDPRVARGRIGVGLNWPGLSLRALVGNRWMLEARGQYEKEARAYGGRIYLYVFPGDRVYPYVGAEGDYGRFYGGGDVSYEGYLGEAFAGIEYFMWRKISLSFDFGPAQAELEQGNAKASGMRYVVNFGLTVYF